MKNNIGKGDLVKLVRLKRYEDVSNQQPLSTIGAYENVVGIVHSIQHDGAIRIVWNNDYSHWFSKDDAINCLKVVKKRQSLLTTLAKTLQPATLGVSHSKFALYINKTSKYSKRIGLTKKPTSTECYEYSCFAMGLSKIPAYENTFYTKANRLHLDQSHACTKTNTYKLPTAQIRRYFDLCKKNGMLPEYVCWNEFKQKKMTLDMDLVKNSLQLYLYACILRNLRECPGIVTASLKLYKITELDWIDSFLIATNVVRPEKYYSFFQLARDNDGMFNQYQQFEEFKIDITQLAAARHFIENDINTELKKYSLYYENNISVSGGFDCYSYVHQYRTNNNVGKNSKLLTKYLTEDKGVTLI